jgi:superfamily II DNA or RNA helicase
MTSESKIHLTNTISTLTCTDEQVMKKLCDCLKFRPAGYFHSQAYKRRIWDGYTRFFTDKGKFLTGLLPEVLFVLQKMNVNVTIDDHRSSIDFAIKSIDERFLQQFQPEGEEKVTLMDYQVDLVNQALKNKRGIITAPTSAGKSFIIAGIVKSLPPNTPTLIVQNRKALATQNYEEMVRWGVDNVGILGGGKLKPNTVTVATVQSVKKMEKLLPHIQCLIVDEIHDMMSDTAKNLYKKLTGCGVRIAVSATPFKSGGDDKVQKFFVKGYFGGILKTKTTESGVLTTKELQNRGRLSTSKAYFFEIHTPQIPYAVYQDAVQLGIVENNELHEKTIKIATKLRGRTLILVDRIAHGDILQRLLPNAIWIQGSDTEKTRKEVIKKLQTAKGDLIAIGTQQIFNTGINVFVHNLINAAGGQADHTIIQRMGRGLRTAKDKKDFIYIDFLFRINDYLEKHSLKRMGILGDEGHALSILTLDDFLSQVN